MKQATLSPAPAIMYGPRSTIFATCRASFKRCNAMLEDLADNLEIIKVEGKVNSLPTYKAINVVTKTTMVSKSLRKIKVKQVKDVPPPAILDYGIFLSPLELIEFRRSNAILAKTKVGVNEYDLSKLTAIDINTLMAHLVHIQSKLL